MSIADKITSIAGHLEDDYTALEQLGVSVEDRNIENIKDMANQIYAKFPKTSYAEGSNITLSNTLKGKLDFEDGIVGIGDTQQNGTPTPDSPVDIEVVRGKNRWGGFTPFSKTMGTLSLTQNKDGSITLNGTASVISSSVTIQEAIDNNIYITLEKGTYTVSGGGNNYVIQIYDTSSNALATISSGQTSVTFTITERKNVICRVFIDSSGTNYNNVNVKLQLEKGSSATPYLPYNTIEVKARGKNKLDFNEWLNTLMDKKPNITAGSIDSYTDNSITITSNGNDCFTSSYTISNNAATNKSFCETYPSLVQEVKGNTKYTISYNRSNTSLIARPFFFYLDENYNYLGLNENRNAVDNATFTTPSNAKYLTFRFGLYGSIGSTLTISNLMIEESPSATSYEPYYTPQIKQLSLGEYEFAKIGNYVDTIEYDVDEDKVYKNKAINKVSLKTLTWGTSLVGTNSYGTSSLSRYIGKVATDINIICSHATGIIFNDRNRFTNTTIYDETNGYVVFRNTSFTSLEDFTTFLNNNNVYAYYVLATATREEITGTLKDQIKALYYSHSFTGTTIIEIDGQLPLIIKVRALKGE